MEAVDPMDDSSNLMAQLVGQLLLAVEGLFYVPLAEFNQSTASLDNLDELQVTFGAQLVRFQCSSDGETLTIDTKDICPMDLGEYGGLCRTDLSQAPQFKSLMSTSLCRLRSISAFKGQVKIGVLLEFAAGSLAICNWGDELKVWDTVPQALFADEGIRIDTD